MKNLEELQQQFINAHCAWTLFCNIEHDIEHTIKSKLPKHIQGKMGVINFVTDFEDFMVLCVNVPSKDVNEVYASLTTVYPSIKWKINDTGHFSTIEVALDDEVIASLPMYLYE